MLLEYSNIFKRAKSHHIATFLGVTPCIVDIEDIKKVVSSTILPVNVMVMPTLDDFDILQNVDLKRVSQGASIYNSLKENFEYKLLTINKNNSYKSLFL